MKQFVILFLILTTISFYAMERQQIEVIVGDAGSAYLQTDGIHAKFPTVSVDVSRSMNGNQLRTSLWRYLLPDGDVYVKFKENNDIYKLVVGYDQNIAALAQKEEVVFSIYPNIYGQ